MALFDQQQQDSAVEARWRPNPYSEGVVAAADTRASFMNGVYRHMALGLGVTGLVAMWAASRGDVAAQVFQHPFMLVIVQLGLVIALSALINRISATTAMALFYLYAASTGLLFSTFFYIYTKDSIATTFFVTGGTFGAMSLYGYATKRDLSGLGSFLFMGLIGIIIATVVNIWLHSTALMWAVTYLGLFVFIGLTAYDTQRIKRIAYQASGGESSRKMAIFGALTLYLDFINMFIYLLDILGVRKSNS